MGQCDAEGHHVQLRRPQRSVVGRHLGRPAAPRDDDTGNHLARRADEQVFSHLSRSFGNWTLGGEWQFVGQRYDDAANRTKLGGYGLVNPLRSIVGKGLGALLPVATNIFDKYYETVNNYGVLGANAFFGIRYAPK